MSLLLPAQRAQYSAIIDKILATSDLATISAKTIRKELAAELDVDLTEQKAAVVELIHERFDHASARDATPIPTIEKTPSANGHRITKKEAKVKNESSATPSTNTPSSISPPSDSASDENAPPKKKVKKNPGKKAKKVDDAKLAAMLQAQENSRGRATRGADGRKHQTVKKRAPKKKSEPKIKADDDSELEIGSDGEVKEKPKKGGFHKLYNLSAPLAELVGEPTLSRPQVVKKLWVHIKANNLQDPADKRQILCDEQMQLVFKQDKVHMFTMNKLLGKQLYDLEE